MAKIYFKRYVWLIDLISRHGYISKRDIDSAWQKSSLNDEREKSIPERTFHNHREAILDMFDIEIAFDRGHGYYISNPEDIDGEGIRKASVQHICISIHIILKPATE